jgi:osmotically-inducible protein OsmY
LGFLGYENGKMHDQTVTKPVNVSQDMIKSDNPADVALVSGIRSALANDELVASDLPNIQIKASNGVVTLSGTVPATLDRDEIVQVVQHSNGVKQINDLIEVRTS